MSAREEYMVDVALSLLENAMGAIHRLNRETNIVDNVDYGKLNIAVWDMEQVLKDWKESYIEDMGEE